MAQIQYTFKRYEQKYLLTAARYEELMPELRRQMVEDRYGRYPICNIYYDTEDYKLIRASVEKPAYKEKFRIRSYGVPDRDSVVFAEIKKKYNGVVYKRRVASPPAEIERFITGGVPLPEDPQIQREIRWLLQAYRPEPRVFLGYERVALTGKEDSSFRITFDQNLRYRTYDLDLCKGVNGTQVLGDGDDRIIMEIKTAAAAPLWLVSLLSGQGIYPTSFSKYGTCYLRHIAGRQLSERKVLYAR